MFHRSKPKKKAPKNTESKATSTRDEILLSLLVSLTEDQKAAIIEFIKSFK